MKLIGKSDTGIEFWERAGEVYRVAAPCGLDTDGFPRGARWECSRSHFDRYRDSVYAWVHHYTGFSVTLFVDGSKVVDYIEQPPDGPDEWIRMWCSNPDNAKPRCYWERVLVDGRVARLEMQSSLIVGGE